MADETPSTSQPSTTTTHSRTTPSQPPGEANLPYSIRPATESDVPEILAMIKELAIYEHALDSVLATEESLLSTLSFPSTPDKGHAKTILISLPSSYSASTSSESTSTSIKQAPTSSEPDSGETVAGFALYFTSYSTWRAAPGIYLEDLFVRARFRGLGLGSALLRALANEALAIGAHRLEWSVLKWNEPSIRFYVGPTVGAQRMEEWVGMRVEGVQELTRLALGGRVK